MSEAEAVSGDDESVDAEVETTPPSDDAEGLGARLRVLAHLGSPFTWGFLAAAGALVAVWLGGALVSLSTVLVWIGAALFIALALDPMVRWLEAHKMGRGLAIAVVFVTFALLLAGLLALVIPTAIAQITLFAASVPEYLTAIQQSDWLQSIISSTGQTNLYDTVFAQARTWLSDPANLLAIGGGALSVGTGLVNGISGTLIVMVLTLYFLASLRSIKRAAVVLAPAYARPKLTGFVERITGSVGGYVSGMGLLAMMNAVFAFILLSILGVPFASMLAVCALAITFIPMVGPTLFWILGTLVTFFTSWVTGLIFAGVYFAYMQVEAYVFTPRVMTKAVEIPGSLVLIGAIVGGTLLGLLGALVAVPVTASLLMVVQEVFLPRQDAKTVAPPT
ncbi:MAG TPA: AI-2E family transporter [Propionicimonas sp.]|jgi:predicted PurR-regulated permease PerM|nr:AI-2E family transporter [Propionicimonas sp.]